MITSITYKELFEQYTDLEDTFLLDNFMIEIQYGEATEDTEVYISEVTKEEFENNGGLFDSEGNSWEYIPGRTFELTDKTNSFTIGYVYSKTKLENLVDEILEILDTIDYKISKETIEKYIKMQGAEDLDAQTIVYYIRKDNITD